jgi:hypothetical protein
MRIQWLIGIVMAAGLEAQPLLDCALDVYVLRVVPMPASMLSDAKKKTAAIFNEIGIHLRLHDGMALAALRW